MVAKDKGIQAMLDAWGLGREGCVVFGDGGNDIDMLDYAGIGVAMGNAHPSVKSYADHATQSVDVTVLAFRNSVGCLCPGCAGFCPCAIPVWYYFCGK